jgi:GTP-binding protein Era
MDLCTNKRKLRWLIGELEDLGKFDKIFYVSCNTGYGIEELKQFLEKEAVREAWQYHPSAKTTHSQADLMEEVMKSVLFSRFYYEIPY